MADSKDQLGVNKLHRTPPACIVETVDTEDVRVKVPQGIDEYRHLTTAVAQALLDRVLACFPPRQEWHEVAAPVRNADGTLLLRNTAPYGGPPPPMFVGGCLMMMQDHRNARKAAARMARRGKTEASVTIPGKISLRDWQRVGNVLHWEYLGVKKNTFETRKRQSDLDLQSLPMKEYIKAIPGPQLGTMETVARHASSVRDWEYSEHDFNDIGPDSDGTVTHAQLRQWCEGRVQAQAERWRSRSEGEDITDAAVRLLSAAIPVDFDKDTLSHGLQRMLRAAAVSDPAEQSEQPGQATKGAHQGRGGSRGRRPVSYRLLRSMLAHGRAHARPPGMEGRGVELQQAFIHFAGPQTTVPTQLPYGRALALLKWYIWSVVEDMKQSKMELLYIPAKHRIHAHSTATAIAEYLVEKYLANALQDTLSGILLAVQAKETAAVLAAMPENERASALAAMSDKEMRAGALAAMPEEQRTEAIALMMREPMLAEQEHPLQFKADIELEVLSSSHLPPIEVQLDRMAFLVDTLGADVNMRSSLGLTPLTMLISVFDTHSSTHAHLLQVLVDHGADLDATAIGGIDTIRIAQSPALIEAWRASPGPNPDPFSHHVYPSLPQPCTCLVSHRPC